MLDPEQDVPPSQNSLSAAQRSAIEGIVATSVHNALDAFRSSTGAFTPSPVLQSPRTPGMDSPLGLSRPVDRGLEDKILRGECFKVVTHSATSRCNTSRRHVAATNRFMCTGEFLWKSLSLQQYFVAAVSRTNSNWFDFLRLVAATKWLNLVLSQRFAAYEHFCKTSLQQKH